MMESFGETITTSYQDDYEGIQKERQMIDETDTKSNEVGVSELLISPVLERSSPSEKVYKTGRLYQFSTREKGSGEVIFGNIFEITYNRESNDLFVIKKKLQEEINQYNKDREKHKEEYAINSIIDKAIENIYNLYIWKLEPKTVKEFSYIQKIKIGKAKDLLETRS